MDHSNRLEELIDKHENTLFRAALAILGDVQEAEDAVQDTFLRYLEKRPELRDGDHEKAWLLKVTANRCRSVLRTRKRHPAVELLDIYPAPDPDSRENVRENCRRFCAALGADVHDVVQSHQVHRDTVRHVTAADRGKGLFQAN